MKSNRDFIGDDDDSFGPGTDLIISLLAVALVAIALGANLYQKKLDKVVSELNTVKNQVALAENKVKDFKKQETPIINIPSDSYQFESNSAVLPSSLENTLSSSAFAIRIENIVREYQVDVVEVIGHTDDQKVDRSTSNLDLTLEKVATERQGIGILTPGSNADLGLMRALSVIQGLQRNPKFKGLKFRAYSAAQLIAPDGGSASVKRESDPTRRRIEIRFTRLGKIEDIRNNG